MTPARVDTKGEKTDMSHTLDPVLDIPEARIEAIKSYKEALEMEEKLTKGG